MLDGIRVIELATYIAAPGAGGLLSDWGAEVVKVEAPEGDPWRLMFQSAGVDEENGNPVFDYDNRGKKGIIVDTSQEEGREIIVQLIKNADVFLTNIRPGGLERARLDWPTLRRENPKLIYASVSGYGLTGAERDRPGFDIAAFWARAGVGQMHTPKGQDPVHLRTAVGDHFTSITTVSGILAALLERQKTGKGKLVETSLLRTGAYAVSSDLSIQQRLGRLASARPRHAAINPLANFFQTRDGYWLCIVPRQGKADWANFAHALERLDLLDDERFANPKARRDNKSALVDEMDKIFAERDLEEWATRLDERDIVWSPLQTPAQVLADPQAHAAGIITEMPTGNGDDTVPTLASPVRFHDDDAPPEIPIEAPKGPAPEKGQHTEEVLRDLGFDAAQIEKLRGANIIA